MGGIVEHPPGEPYVETAFRTVLFTDIERLDEPHPAA